MLKERIEEQYATVSSSCPLKSLRERGWERFQTLGLPDKKAEAFRYLPLSQLYAQTFQEAVSVDIPYKDHIYPECQSSHIVFVNGIYAPHLSKTPQEMVVLPLAHAMTTYGNFLQSRFAKSLQEEKDPFASLNAALHGGGVFVYIPPKTHMKAPLQCHHIITEGMATRPRLQIFVGAHSGLDWITTVQREGSEACLMNSVIDIALEEGAHFRSTQLYYGLSSKDWYFDALRATLKRNSRLHTISVTTGAKSVRQDYHATLAGEGADASLQGIWMLDGHAQAHTHVVMDHMAPHCRSMQLFKGVLNGFSQSSFEGKIYVRPEAQKTEAYQLNKHLLLGERVLANSKPNLEIFADDVKASHGSTTSQVDPEQLFYLKARGIPEKVAQGLLVLGFCQELVDNIPQAFIREKMRTLIREVLV